MRLPAVRKSQGCLNRPSQDSSQDSTIFRFPAISRPTSPITIKRRVFVVIMEGKHEVKVRVRVRVRLG